LQTNSNKFKETGHPYETGGRCREASQYWHCDVIRKVNFVTPQERRDPRFSSVSAGQINPHLHDQSYGFLPKMLRSELLSLKTAVSSAAKAERTCTWTEKPARTAERERLEGERGRLRTRIERTERETADREVLAGMKRQEREKQKQGKGQWFMKKGESSWLTVPRPSLRATQARSGTSSSNRASMHYKRRAAKQQSRKPSRRNGKRLRARRKRVGLSQKANPSV